MTAFSPNFGFAELTPFDPSIANTWGTATTANFGLIDSAIGGLLSLSVAGSSNVVLTATQGAANQARNSTFVFTGALTGNINVLWPQGVSQKFSVTNSTTGAFTLSLGANNGSGSPAGSIIVVPTGASVAVASDGTHVVQEFNYFAGALGIGMAPANILDITQATSGSAYGSIKNTTNGAASLAAFVANNSTGSTTGIFQTSSAYTPATVYKSDGGLVYSNSSGGLGIATGVAQPIYFYTNAAERARLDSSGNFLLGVTSVGGSTTVVSPTAIVSGIFQTATSNTGSIGAGVTAILFQLPLNTSGTWIVSYSLNVADAASYSQAAIIMSDNGRTALSYLRQGTFGGITVDSFPTSPQYVYGTNGASSPQTLYWTAIRLA